MHNSSNWCLEIYLKPWKILKKVKKYGAVRYPRLGNSMQKTGFSRGQNVDVYLDFLEARMRRAGSAAPYIK